MKNLLKLPILLITLLLIFSCGRNAEADVESINDIVERIELLNDKENLEDRKEILLEAEEIFSYYASAANIANTANRDKKILPFIKLLNKVDEFDWVKDGQDLRTISNEIKEEIRKLERK